MFDKGEQRGALGRRVRGLADRAVRLAGVVPACLALALKPFGFLNRFYPEPVRVFLESWTAEMLAVYVGSLGRRAYMDQPCTVREPASYAPRVRTAPEYRLTEGEVRSFYANGFLGPFTLCPREEMAEIRSAVSAELERPSAVYGFRTGRDRHLDCESVYRLARHPALTERLAQLLGPDLLLWRTQAFHKPPGAPAVAWHQASTYLLEEIFRPTLFPPDLNELFQLGAWLAFDDVTVENGCMQFVPGSHRRIHTMRVGGGAARFAQADVTLECPIDPGKVVSMEMEAGQFVIFTEQTVHGSPPNRSARPRWGLAFRVVPPEVVVYGAVRAHRVAYLKETYDLTRWGAVVVRGSDTAGVNRLADPFPHPGPAGEAARPPCPATSGG